MVGQDAEVNVADEDDDVVVYDALFEDDVPHPVKLPFKLRPHYQITACRRKPLKYSVYLWITTVVLICWNVVHDSVF